MELSQECCKLVGIYDPHKATVKGPVPFSAYLFHDKEQKHGAIAVTMSTLMAIRSNLSIVDTCSSWKKCPL